MTKLQACLIALFLVVVTPSYAKGPPSESQFEQVLNTAHALYKDVQEGENADYIPALAKVDANLFGIALVTAKGNVYTKGDIATEFSIQSISKVFTLSLAMEQQGANAIQEKIGVNAT